MTLVLCWWSSSGSKTWPVIICTRQAWFLCSSPPFKLPALITQHFPMARCGITFPQHKAGAIVVGQDKLSVIQLQCKDWFLRGLAEELAQGWRRAEQEMLYKLLLHPGNNLCAPSTRKQLTGLNKVMWLLTLELEPFKKKWGLLRCMFIHLNFYAKSAWGVLESVSHMNSSPCRNVCMKLQTVSGLQLGHK